MKPAWDSLFECFFDGVTKFLASHVHMATSSESDGNKVFSNLSIGFTIKDFSSFYRIKIML